MIAAIGHFQHAQRRAAQMPVLAHGGPWPARHFDASVPSKHAAERVAHHDNDAVLANRVGAGWVRTVRQVAVMLELGLDLAQMFEYPRGGRLGASRHGRSRAATLPLHGCLRGDRSGASFGSDGLLGSPGGGGFRVIGEQRFDPVGLCAWSANRALRLAWPFRQIFVRVGLKCKQGSFRLPPHRPAIWGDWGRRVRNVWSERHP